jgi:hypothetical protein
VLLQGKMVVTWQERDHDNEDMAALADAGCRNAMRACGLMKFFRTPRLRAQPDLLELLVRAWNPVDGKFTIRGRDIEFDSNDIYFLTGLSRRGPVPILEGQRPSGETLDRLMARVCPWATKTRSGKCSIPSVGVGERADIVLRTILFLVTRAAGSLANHEASKANLLLALDCLEPTIFNWALAVTNSMKRQLNNCRRGESKQFGYGSILLPLMFERVPALRLQTMVLDPPRNARETRATRWARVMPRGGGGRSVSWGLCFREWLESQVIFVEDWPYAGIDFRGDPDMPLPAGEQWDDGGMTLDFFIFVYMMFLYFLMYMF